MAESKGMPRWVWGLIACVIALPICGVVGILAAIAIPNFLKFQCKSIQSEAKTNLSGLFTAEKAFYGEYNTYTSDLVALNWGPDGEPHYLYGFAYAGPPETTSIAGITDYDPDRKDTSHAAVVAKFGYRTTKMLTRSGQPIQATDLPEDSFVEESEFTAAAVGDVDGDMQLDVWTIDQVRSLRNLDDDCSR